MSRCRKYEIASKPHLALLGLLIFLVPRGFAEPARENHAVRLAKAAEVQVGVTRRYDPAYVALAYPGGDVPLDRGVCTDVVVRAFRGIGIDLQKQLHDDMRRSFSSYPRKLPLVTALSSPLPS